MTLLVYLTLAEKLPFFSSNMVLKIREESPLSHFSTEDALFRSSW